MFLLISLVLFFFHFHRPFVFLMWNETVDKIHINLFFFIVFLYEIINGSPVNDKFLPTMRYIKAIFLSTYFHKTLLRWKNKYVTMLTFIFSIVFYFSSAKESLWFFLCVLLTLYRAVSYKQWFQEILRGVVLFFKKTKETKKKKKNES